MPESGGLKGVQDKNTLSISTANVHTKGFTISNLYAGQVFSPLSVLLLLPFMKLGKVQIAYLPLSSRQNKPCPLVSCICISVFQILPGSKWFRIFKIVKTKKGYKANE